jgi:hypothetical protein
MYEPRHIPPIPTSRFTLRLLSHAALSIALIAVSLWAGMLGYRYYEQMSWLDAFVNAAMLLGGMGPVKTDGLSDAGKLFAGLYALYAGLAFIAVMGIMLTPVVHRILHRFHWAEGRDAK